jgi:hypothetical protein
MGLLSLPRPKRKITDRPKMVKEIVNRQRVAKSPGTEAKFFQLQRKPGHIYYYLVAKSKSRLTGKLFELECIRINIKDYTLKSLILNTHRNDLIRPILASEFKAIINEKGKKTEEDTEKLLNRLRKRGVPFI